MAGSGGDGTAAEDRAASLRGNSIIFGGAADLDALGQTGQVTLDAFAIEPLPAFFHDV